MNRNYFEDQKFENVNFSETDLNNSSITNFDLLDAIFENTNLEKADFRNSMHYSIDPENNNVKGAKFSLPDVA